MCTISVFEGMLFNWSKFIFQTLGYFSILIDIHFKDKSFKKDDLPSPDNHIGIWYFREPIAI